ncbi:chemotaxis protein [Xaviernesmea oryzae]|uniref:Chemotaxis protein n=1 Tax=Xaviernesmea oryzae TaxID=464029 RepID=A0A1Q9ASH7_9HYPH|nr:methyl-accepting chemotaxis protein [Xaviernesmea oryzae]OLP58377.1 chemotaxis protein [Xaviernesmea oryzae]SEL45918.1 methyl-accepting chemotaxis protein [Xaviernesmea oryzae]
MTIANLSIFKKISLLLALMGMSAVMIAATGGQGLFSLASALQNTGAREEVAREAMDLRVDIIAISRMTYQLALAPEKAGDFAAETEKRAGEMLARLPKIASTADANEQRLLQTIEQALDRYFGQIRQMVKAAGTAAGQEPAAMKAELAKALDAQKAVTAAVKDYSASSSQSLAAARAAAIAQSSDTILVLLGATAVCIAVGAALSFRLARKDIVGPIRMMTAVMAEMAAGRPPADIPATDRRDEIGEMARALEVFRANEAQMRSMERQEAALHAQSRDLQVSISAIVSAAAGGDFSQRISKSYEDADLQRFATGINELVASVDQGITEVRRVVAALADADLTQQMNGRFQGAFGELQHNVNATMQILSATMRGIQEAGRTITDNSSELSSAAGQLAHRTEQQAASLEETAAALEEITTTVKASTDRAQEASHLVAETKASAQRSGAIVQSAIDAMARIENSSQKISQIISVIDEIAFQTNLLALNAGVEAARAGEAGRGFAVVAQEVRELAQRSAQAAKEIKTLISSSAGEVKGGVSLVASTGEALREIDGLVNRVNEHVTMFARAAQEQASALSEINSSVNHMDQMTQQNAAMVEETTASSEVLASEARRLQAELTRFRLEAGRTASTQRAAA